MVDIHCHILHQYDDGSPSLSESLEMARIAAESGVTDIAVTPHFVGKSSSLKDLPLLMDHFQELSQAIAAEGIPITLHLGAEILCLPETADLARHKLLPTIGDTHYLLVEFCFDESLRYMDDMLRRIKSAGYTPIVAHPERYRAISQDPLVLKQWFRSGYVLQLNKGSILGAFGRRAERAAHIILDAGLAHLIASDAHSASHRTPSMNPLHHWFDRNLSAGYARILTEENPRRIIRGESLVPVD